MKITDCSLIFKEGQKIKEMSGFENDWYSIEITEEKSNNNKVYNAELTAIKNMELSVLEIEFSFDLNDLSYSANGYQSWSESPIINMDTKKKNLNQIIRKMFHLGRYGDYDFTQGEKNRKWMHSHLFLDLVKDGQTKLFLADLHPYESYTWFSVDYDKNTITASTDLEGISLDENDSINAVTLIECSAKNDYFDHLDIDVKKSKKITGWTSWYNYYTGISADILNKNIDALEKSKIPMDVFQIDDGYFTAVGDWLSPNTNFPKGLKPLAQKIISKGWKAGIWLAPFVCERESSIFKEKSHWILRDSKGNLQTAGWNPGWSGVFYALDIYNEEFRQYLFEVFNTMKEEWGYRFFKLDFLYAASLKPHNGKTRAMIMSDAMDLLIELTKGALFLSCGVPIGPAMGKCDYCRIGADISHGFEDKFLKSIGYRERVSTVSAINSIKTRGFLNGKAFGNDPDVFILRNTKEIKMTDEEKELLFNTNMQNSSLVFFSDCVLDYTDETIKKIQKSFEEYRTDK